MKPASKTNPNGSTNLFFNKTNVKNKKIFHSVLTTSSILVLNSMNMYSNTFSVNVMQVKERS